MDTIQKKYTLQIVNDCNPRNPWKEWDCEPPLWYDGGRDFGIQSYGLEYENPIKSLLLHITDAKIQRHSKKLLDIVGYTEEHFQYAKNNWGYKKTEWIREKIEEMELTIENIKTLADFAGIFSYSFDSSGYSQGDYIEAIFILTPEWIKKVGTPKKSYLELCKGSKKLFDAYAWGDVYGYRLIENKPLYREDGTLSEETEDEIIYSCWGFYGEDGLEDIKDNLPEDCKHLFDDAKENIIYS